VIGQGPWFWAAPFEAGQEFGGRGLPSPLPTDALELRYKGRMLANTTLAVIATDASLTKAQTRRLAVMAQDGLARAIYPVHTPADGDIVFAAATGKRILANSLLDLLELGAVAANVLARAVARAVYEASALPFSGALPSWKDRFGP
jgi:L-aminopeptidase/D-esterase-like protein